MSHSRNSSIASENEFKLRYPSINQQIPPVPEEVPQSPPTSISYLRTSLRDSTIEPSVSPPSSHAPSPPVHRYSQVYDYSPSPGPQFDSPYPVIDKTLNEKSPSPDENLYLRPKSYGRPKKEVPDGYLRPTDYTTARIHQSNDVPHNNTYHKNPNYQTYTTTAPPPGPPPQPYQPPVVYPSPPSQSIPIAVPNQLYVDPTMYANSGYQQQQQQPQPYQPHPPPHQQMRSVYHVQHPQQVAQYANNQYTHVPPPNFQQQQQQQHHAMKKHKYEKQKEYSVCGLKNFGSSCYINSTIQLLFGVYAFRNIFDHGYQKYIKDPRYLKMLSKLSGGSKNSLLLSDAISGLLRTFQNNGGVPVSPSKFIRITASLKPDLNIPYEQQDAQEFLMFVLDRLHEELAEKKHDDYDPEEAIRRWKISIDFDDKEQYLKWCKSLHEHEGISPITDLFQGHLRNKLKCNKCGYESINYSSFSILSLPIPSNHSHEMVDLTQCLRYYIQDEVLSGDNAWHCPKCNGEVPTLNNHPVFESKRSGIFKLGGRKKQQQQQQQKTSKSDPTSSTISIKSLMFVKLPTILFIHLSRFSMFNLTDKLNTRIRYPFVLKFNNHGHEISYKLSGIINHFGNLKSGHYTALINKSNVHEKAKNLDNLINPYWCLFDDDNVTCNIASGNRDPQLNDSVSSDVYVLCYERIDL
ncbi:UBP7 Ubiquitin carboxyl-terminal hydrolase 7 [Candida maltosa Xu316]